MGDHPSFYNTLCGTDRDSCNLPILTVLSTGEDSSLDNLPVRRHVDNASNVALHCTALRWPVGGWGVRF